MSAIYQRARPIRWEDIVGQEHVKDVLKTALEQGRVGHAYLFSGPRGVGKTTTARLIAMTANCTSSGPKPCGECESCLAVRSGNHPDVLEIDAASNNSVDDVRDLREKVGLAAMRGGKKIYILDEAHMMSRAAFNALLKTLEEPPSHVIFILATTEPEKIIPTILSRCQHYRFRRLTPEEIAGKLSGLVSKEGMNADPDALNLIGRLADGAMRDGESLLERMLAAGTAITRSSVEEALGLPPGERVRSIAGALVLGDAGAALSGAAQLYRDGFAARTVVEGLVAAFGAALHAELGLSTEGKLEGADVPRLLKLQAALDEQESRFVRSADQQSLELSLTHAILAADSGGAAPASGPVGGVPTDLTQRLNRLEKELATLRSSGVASGSARSVAAPIPEFVPTGRQVAAPASAQAAESQPQVAEAAVRGNWADVTKQASIQLKAFLKPATMYAEPGYVSLTYEDKNAFHAKQVAAKFDEVARLVLKVFGPVTFELLAPDGLGRKQKLGGPAAAFAAPDESARSPLASPAPAGLAPTTEPAAAPTRALSAEPPETAQPPAPADIPDFDPAPRRAAPRDLSPERVISQSAAADFSAPVDPPAPIPQAPSAPPPRRTNVATLERPELSTSGRERRVDPPSPDDVAAAPLPDEPPAPWTEEHVADSPPAPADASGGDLVTPVGASRELYVVEAITEEPDWGDIGGGFGRADVPPDLGDSPFGEFVPKRPAPQAAPKVQEAQLQPQASVVSTPVTPSRPGDIRAHPLYEEVKSRFSGRVREIGKNRNYQPASEEVSSDDSSDDTEA